LARIRHFSEDLTVMTLNARRLDMVFIALVVALFTYTAVPSGESAGLQRKSDAAQDTQALDPNRILLPLKAIQQTKSYTCGPATLISLLRFYDRDGDELQIAKEAKCSPDKGTSPANMVAWLKNHDFDVSWGENGSLKLLRENLGRGIPTLVEWIDWGGHWVIVVGYDTRGTDTERDDVIYFADPADGLDDIRDGLTSFHAKRFESMWFDAFLFERPMHKVQITAVPRKNPQ
jgi:hypothetical protein